MLQFLHPFGLARVVVEGGTNHNLLALLPDWVEAILPALGVCQVADGKETAFEVCTSESKGPRRTELWEGTLESFYRRPWPGLVDSMHSNLSETLR